MDTYGEALGISYLEFDYSLFFLIMPSLYFRIEKTRLVTPETSQSLNTEGVSMNPTNQTDGVGEYNDGSGRGKWERDRYHKPSAVMVEVLHTFPWIFFSQL